MSYIEFKTSGVEYRLILSRHGTKRKEPIDGLDALVVETGSIWQEDYAGGLTKDRELANYLEEIAKRNIPIYSVDNKGRSYSLHMATDFGHMLVPPLMAYGVSKLSGADNYTAYNIALGTFWGETLIIVLSSSLGNGISKFFVKINSALSLVRQAPREELRNALAAKKIKKGVVPHLLAQYPERFQERNPRIGIIYGAGHYGIKECLESDLRAGFTLGLHKYYGLRFILDRDTLRDFYEYRLNGNGSVKYQKLQVKSI